ncbi:MAG TPA: oxidoreductase, partial [Acidobacteriota bacterium]
MPAPAYRVDEKLKEYATLAQQRAIDAVNQYGSYRRAAKSLGVNYSTVQQAVTAAKNSAARRGYAPKHDLTHEVPSPFVVKGVSTLYDESGALRLQWVKSKLDDAKAEEAIREFVEWLVKDAKGLAPSIPAPKHSVDDLLAVYPMGDPHFGMYAWAAETGDDFDTEIAEKLTCAAIDRLVDSAPPADTALILELGDFFHADDSSNLTPTHGFALDVDTRWAKVMQIGLRAMVYVVKRAAEKHKKVIVRIKRGNHDPHSSFALALALDAYFHGQERIKVDLSPAVHWYYRFGKVLIGSTHGDTTKMKDMPGIMAADRPEDWGQTKFRYWYAGHIHHIEVKEFPGVVVEYFRT